MEKNIVILTKSIKNKKYCIAGLDVDTQSLVRLVSDDEASHGAIEGNGIYPFDFVKVDVISEKPLKYQPENILIGEISERSNRISPRSILDFFLEKRPPYFNPPFIFNNANNHLKKFEMNEINRSLEVAIIENLEITHPTAKKTKASFSYNMKTYNDISVTDPDYFYGNASMSKALCIFSLPDVSFDIPGTDKSYFYKFLAKITSIS